VGKEWEICGKQGKNKIRSCKNEDKTRIILHNFVSMCISPIFLTHVNFVCGAKNENFIEKKNELEKMGTL
jgi:hypothetical protein